MSRKKSGNWISVTQLVPGDSFKRGNHLLSATHTAKLIERTDSGSVIITTQKGTKELFYFTDEVYKINKDDES